MRMSLNRVKSNQVKNDTTWHDKTRQCVRVKEWQTVTQGVSRCAVHASARVKSIKVRWRMTWHHMTWHGNVSECQTMTHDACFRLCCARMCMSQVKSNQVKSSQAWHNMTWHDMTRCQSVMTEWRKVFQDVLCMQAHVSITI